MYLGNKRWDLLLGGAPGKLFKTRPSSDHEDSGDEPEPAIRKARVYVVIENGLVPE